MSKQSQLNSTKMQQHRINLNYFDVTSSTETDGIDRIDDSVMGIAMINEATVAVAVAGEEEMEEGEIVEDDDYEENQLHFPTYSNKNPLKPRYRKQSRGSCKLSIDRWKLSSELTPNYSEISKQQFKMLLCQANPASYRQQLQQYLSNQKLLSFIQKYAHLMSMRFQLEIEKDYWKYVSDGLLPAIQWLSQMPKNLTRRYSINWNYPRTEHNIRHRQQLIENKLNKICHQVQVHSQNYLSCWTVSNKNSIDQAMCVIRDTLKIMIEKDLQYLHTRYEQKKILIQYDAYDVYLLKIFFDLYPIEAQKTNVQTIWRGKRKCCKREMHCMKTNLLKKARADTSSIYNDNNQFDSDPYHQQYLTSLLNTFNSTMLNIIEARQENIQKRTQQIIKFQNTLPF